MVKSQNSGENQAQKRVKLKINKSPKEKGLKDVLLNEIRSILLENNDQIQNSQNLNEQTQAQIYEVCHQKTQLELKELLAEYWAKILNLVMELELDLGKNIVFEAIKTGHFYQDRTGSGMTLAKEVEEMSKKNIYSSNQNKLIELANCIRTLGKKIFLMFCETNKIYGEKIAEWEQIKLLAINDVFDDWVQNDHTRPNWIKDSLAFHCKIK